LGCCYKREKGSYFESKRSSQLAEEVFFIKRNYVVKWNNAYLHADAHLFSFDEKGKAITLK
jgi:hypothetical protein